MEKLVQSKVIMYLPLVVGVLGLLATVFDSFVLSAGAMLVAIVWSVAKYIDNPRAPYLILAITCGLVFVFRIYVTVTGM